MERGGFCLVNAELYDWNIGMGINMSQYRPCAMIETPSLVQRNRQWRQQFLNAACQ